MPHRLIASRLFFRNERRAGARTHCSNESAARADSDHVLRAGVLSGFRAWRLGRGASAHQPLEPSEASPWGFRNIGQQLSAQAQDNEAQAAALSGGGRAQEGERRAGEDQLHRPKLRAPGAPSPALGT